MKRLWPKWGETSGSVAIEYAMVSPIIIFLMISILQFGIYFADTSSVQQGVFLLARAIQSSTTPPTNASAKALVINSCLLPHQAGDFIVSVSAVPSTPVNSANMPPPPTSDSFAPPGKSKPALIRVVAKRTRQFPLLFLSKDVWSPIFAANIDYSVVAVAQ